MIRPTTDDFSARLIAEIERYLEAVELFRTFGCELDWRTEAGVADVRTSAAARSSSQATV
jgi:hypothetical protein